MRPNGRCKSCHAPIRWAETEGGKGIPLDPDPVEGRDGAGLCYVVGWADGKPVVRITGKLGLPDAEPLGYQSHFVTCPQAAEHRKQNR